MSEQIEAYCVKCKTKRPMLNPEAVFTSNGAPGTRGTCSVCGTALFRMGATEAHATLTKPAPAPKQAKSKTAKSAGAKKRSTSAKSASTGAVKKTATTKTAKKGVKRTAAKSEPRTSAPTGKLVIVESPAKARSVGRFLGKGYTVKASKGHVRDLLVSQISVDVKNNFEPKYRVPNDARATVKELQTAVNNAREIFLATDPDREGEAIAWHLIAATAMEGKPIKRVVFHEITEPAIQEAFSQPRDLDINLVNAQQARRIVDRLVGYNITELLWEKVRNRLSAGRVQSIATRLIVDREREIEVFIPREYWTLDARLKKQKQKDKNDARPFIARLMKIEAKDVDFAAQDDVLPHLDVLKRSEFVVADVKRGERVRKPSAPFTTSTLQQEASRRLGFSAKKTMSVAQKLYEGDVKGEVSGGLITYMRTDSLNISPQAQTEAREFITKRFGKEFIPAKAPIYKTRAKGAQEAHEAIRPTSAMNEPDSIKHMLTSEQYRLYNLIWQRFVASQMENAVYNTLRVDIDAGTAPKNRPYHFRVSGSTIKFMGFLALYEDAQDEDVELDEDEGRILPDFVVGEQLDLLDLLPEQHFTQPPPRYTEASLVRTLEEYGIGRPSTYAPTVAVIQDREYVVKQENKRLVPTETGRIVNDLLTKFFPEVMDYQFTAKMEDSLDDIAEGKREWQPMLRDFYDPFENELHAARQSIPNIQQEEQIGRDCPLCTKPLVIRYGRFGKFIGCSDYPTCRHTEPWLERMGIPCPTCGTEHGGDIIVRRTKRGRTFYGCSRYPDCEFTSWKRPLQQPCPNCGGLLIEQNRTSAQCLNCSNTYPVNELPSVEAELA